MLGFFWSNSNVVADENDALKIAGDTGCGILGSLLANPQAAVAAAGACIYGTAVTKDLVDSLINTYFDGEDQAFANKYCLTITRANGETIAPTDRTNCS